MQFGSVRAAIAGLDADTDTFRGILCILHEDIEVAIFVEDARVQQFELALTLPTPVLFHKLTVRKLRLRILVEHPHITVGRRVVEIEPVVLYILAAIALIAGEAKHPFLQDGIAAIPEGECEDQQLVSVADAGDAILAPAIGAAAGVIMGEVVPGAAVGAVVFANRTPGALADIRPPLAPRSHSAGVGLVQAAMLGRGRRSHMSVCRILFPPGSARDLFFHRMTRLDLCR